MSTSIWSSAIVCYEIQSSASGTMNIQSSGGELAQESCSQQQSQGGTMRTFEEQCQGGTCNLFTSVFNLLTFNSYVINMHLFDGPYLRRSTDEGKVVRKEEDDKKLSTERESMPQPLDNEVQPLFEQHHKSRKSSIF